MNSVYAPLKNCGAARRGTSLIEILVVLVILVFGILSVIRLFPAGFLVFRSAQYNGVAQQIGQGQLESISKDTSSIADGVYVYNDMFGFDPTIAPGNLGAYKSDPTNTAFGDINKARFVLNETVTVPPPHAVTVPGGAYTSSSVHVLNYGPVVLAAQDSISVISAPWTGQIVNSAPNGVPELPTYPSGPPVDMPDDFLVPGRAQYLIDYAGHRMAVPPATYAQNFVFSITVQLTPTTQKNVTLVSTVPAGQTGWQKVDLTGVGVADSISWIVDSAVLYRPYMRMDTNALTAMHTLSTFTSDPYEFEVRYGNIGSRNANFGVLDFNPLAGGSSGAPPLKAKISYLVYDWHVLHEDHTLPFTSADRTVRLGIEGLKKTGDVQRDQTLFAGLFGSSAVNEAGDVMVCNLETGQAEVYNTNVPNGTTNAGDLDGDTPVSGVVGISYKSGRVTFPIGATAANGAPGSPYNEDNPSPNSNGAHIRIYYMGSADWGVALQKAPATYLPTASKMDLVLNSSSPPNLYYVNAVPGSALRVYFPNCDYGKTVEISGILKYKDSVGNDVTMPIRTVTSAINKPEIYNSKDVGYIDLLDSSPSSPYAPLSISSVRGVSANAIVVWRENDRWKSRSVDTLLPRN